LNVLLLEALTDGPMQQGELRRVVGSPAQTTLRAGLRRLTEIGVVEKRRRNRFPGTLEYELTRPGRDLLFVLDVLRRWLERSADGPLAVGSGGAKAATKALAEAWSTTMLRALAAGPLSLTELDGVIGSLSYPAIERRLSAMRLAGQIVPQPGNGPGTPYAITEWLRLGLAPLAVAARWERRHLPEATAPIGRLDVETAFLLAVPMLSLPDDATGSFRLAAEVSNGDERRLAGVTVEAAGGRATSCATELNGDPNAWVLGPPGGWLEAVIERDTECLELGGDRGLAEAFLEALHTALFDPFGKFALDPRASIRHDESN
jgi:DNA-binding HxlR family transcriptional regulator